MRNLIFMLMALVLVACNDQSREIRSDNFTDSGCAKNAKIMSRIAPKDDWTLGDEYITYSAKISSEGNYLHIEHFNETFSCDLDTIVVQTNTSDQDNAVMIHEVSYGRSTNCFCPHNLSYDVGPLDIGVKYSFIVYQKDVFSDFDETERVRTTFTVNFTEDASGRIEL